jgi:putative transposase
LLHRLGFTPQVPGHRAAGAQRGGDRRVAGGDLGEGTRPAAATGAYVCVEDEAGQNLRPPKARTWAPRGHTPVVRVSGTGWGRVSAAGLVCLKPGARAHLFYRIRIHRGRKGERRSMSGEDYAGLITAAHRGAWSNMKNGLGSLVARDVDQLAAIIKNRLKRIQYRPAIIESFLAQTGPTLEPQPP